jgi:hypothetical protein
MHGGLVVAFAVSAEQERGICAACGSVARLAHARSPVVQRAIGRQAL